MGIVMVFEQNHPHGEMDIFITSIACDHCGQLIEEDRQGNYYWLPPVDPADGARFPVHFVHKKCCRAFEAENRRPDRMRSWEELRQFTTRLDHRAKGS